MSVNRNNNGSLERIAGGTLYADNPIGTILAFGGSNIPTGWHLCDGTAVSRTTYAELFDIIGTNFGVGDGSTTFNLPDLRGEFLRGAGTNSHSGQGNGANVGEHQDATTAMWLGGGNSFGGYGSVDVDSGTFYTNMDSLQGTAQRFKYANVVQGQDTQQPMYTSRPTNTSVNYIIKMFKVNSPADFEGHDIYSTTERKVGTWIDGKPIYRKVVNCGSINQSKQQPHGISNLDRVITCKGNFTEGTDNYQIPNPSNDNYIVSCHVSTTNIVINVGSDWRSYALGDCYVTLEYTKTTD